MGTILKNEPHGWRPGGRRLWLVGHRPLRWSRGDIEKCIYAVLRHRVGRVGSRQERRQRRVAKWKRVVHYSGPPGRKVSGHESPVGYKCSFVKASVFDKTAERSSLLQRLHERYSNKEQYSKSEEGTPGDVVVAGEVGTTLGSGETH
ncbi:hypothetical protein GN244_ATG19210 [Phytophthora infestans]|uniref:Uncharacterized protein n=1 Tax=Phytophthora infestans TaxID=4787 RepID=A0A833SQ54_PHYIN|nr:hypothetical protein GN244_ATG19210 [Phytophthora infestans]